MQSLHDLLQIMEDLRNPQSGCPWDIEQTFDTIKPYTIEEAYEVADAIEHKDMDALKSELGDLLFQVVFHAQMAKEKGLFDFADVVAGINEKMLRRHPHVFADETVASEAEQAQRWEQLKREERANKARTSKDHTNKAQATSALDGVTSGLPALQWSQKLQKRAAATGFDWPDIAPVFDKLSEELEELHEELGHEDNHDRVMDEYGDVLFVCVNLGKHMKVDAEQALRHANRKFISRFELMEKLATEDKAVFEELSLEEMEAYWQRAKRVLSEKDNS